MKLLEKITVLEKSAENFGLKWENAVQIIAQIQSECLEIIEQLKDLANDSDKLKLQEEIGDLLHAVFSLCVFCQFDPEATLEKSLMKFDRRLQAVKHIALTQGFDTLKSCTFSELMEFWQQAKKLAG